MRITSLILLLLGCSVSAFCQAYGYDYTSLPPASTWTANGTVIQEPDPAGISFPSDAGSFIYQPTVTGTNGNDYEVSMTMQEGGSAAVEYLRASSNALLSLSGSTGNFIAVEETSASVVVEQCVNGIVTQLGSATIPNFPPFGGPLQNGTLRSVIWGTTLWVYFNNQLIYINSALPLTYGQPGIGGHPLSHLSPSYPVILSVSIGRHDVTPPPAPSQTGLRSSILPTAVSLAWQGVTDDSTGGGIGVYAYKVSRNGGAATWVAGAASITDNTAQPNTTYTYTIKAVDFHGNESPAATYTVTTPPANSVDPRRIGIFPTGSYWGGGGEQIDTLSGNLNFSFPLVVARGRTGWSVPVGLSYNSQNWRSDGGANWNLGTDTGFGYGWSLQIGSITPYYAEWTSGVDHYVYTDATGASYRLDQHSGNVWYSQQGIYAWFDAAANKLYFKNGTFWLMGCTSSGGEQDAGTLYPTVIEDANGNQVIVTYKSALLFPAGLVNTSARISTIEDVRRVVNTLQQTWAYQTYLFTYNTDPTTHISHLAKIQNWIGTAENFPAFSYETAPLAPPFGSPDSNYSGATTTRLTAIDVPASGPAGTGSLQRAGRYSFTYDSSSTSTSGGGELTQVTFPWGGHLRWDYSNATYSGGRLLREVSQRYVAADYAGNEWNPYAFSHTDSGGIQMVHTDTTLVDASGVGAKTWTFNTGTSVPAWEVGLTAQFQQLTASGGAPLTADTYIWDQTPASTTGLVTGRNPFISAKTHVLYGTTSPTQSALTQQVSDAFGNITEVKIYPFNVTTGTPLQDYQNTYLSPTGNMIPYMVDRLTKTTLTTGGVLKTLVANYYDASGYNNPPGGLACTGGQFLAWNANYDEYENLGIVSRGLLTQTVTPSKSRCFNYDGYGNMVATSASDGTTASAYPDSTTNYTAPTALTTESYNYSFTYNTWLGITQTTGANGESTSSTYDSFGRPYQFMNPYTYGGWGLGYYIYPTAAVLPTWQMKNAQDGITYALLDGLGRPMQVTRGDSSGPKSYTSSVYAPCACSPLGKLQKVSQPYATSSAVAWTQPVSGDPLKWTSYTYDGIGRTLTVTQPDGVSVTQYAYSGNQTTVTDPNGNWKIFTTDVLGNLTTVTEPDPANPSTATLTTAYTYDWTNHLASSTMTRNGATQTRTFVYNDAGQLISVTNPESGTVTYTYNPTGTLAAKHDANGQDTTFTYDAQNRVTGVSQGGNACIGILYTYGTDVSQYNYGRLVWADYGTLNQTCTPGVAPTSYHEQYIYNNAGGVQSKVMWISRIWTDWNAQNHILNSTVQTTYGYDYWGMPLQTLYSGNDPFNSNPSNPPTVNLRYGYDSMGRLSGMTDGVSGPVWVQGVTYDVANRITQLQYPQYSATASFITEAKTYNVNGQLESMTWTPGMAGQGAPSGAITYSYTDSIHTGNNGQVVRAVDGVSGETISYQYDALKRLLSASSSPNAGGTPAAWTQSYSYDGFGNLTGKTLAGTTAAIPVDPATNRLMNSTGVLSNVSYDSNGNLTGITNVAQATTTTMTYDAANRIASANVGSGTEYYSYDVWNRRIYRKRTNGTEEWTFYGARGEKLGTYGLTLVCDDWNDPNTCRYESALQTTNIWFGSKLIWSGTGAANTSGPVFADRLGTNRANGARFRPYGDEITTTANDHMKFATYNRDAATGLDYADQRYYTSQYGRFNTPDPGYAGALDDPGSLNKYSYVLGDPVNGYDPEGLCSVIGSGITQSAHSDSTTGQEQFANATAGITVTPYSNGSVVGGALKVMAQGLGIPTGATMNWLDAIALAAQTPGPISIYAFSGSGGAFTNAYNWLNPETQARITNITYIDPGNFAQPLASGKPGTNVTLFTDNSDAANIAVQLFGVPPDGPVNVINTGTCGHDENCVFNRFSEQLSQTATNCTVGGGSVFGLPQRKPASGFFSRVWNWIFEPAPVPSVNSTITYQSDPVKSIQLRFGN